MNGSLFLLGGVARAGKDTFATLFAETAQSKGRTVSRFAFADALKQELDPMFRAFGATAYETDPAKKTLIRPMLVAYGCAKRIVSNGRHWIEQIEPGVREALAKGHIVLVTDCRFNTHPDDECGWGKSLGGKIIYIERTLEDGTPVPPANEEEARNDPLLRAGADLVVSWPTSNINELRLYVENAWNQLFPLDKSQS